MTPQPAQADPRAALSLQLERALAGPSFDIRAICRLGNAAYKTGLGEIAARAFRTAVMLLLEMMERGDAAMALEVEAVIYQSFVKAVESEDHYERSFALWREQMLALGRRFRDTAVQPASDARGMAFIFHSGVILGHTEVLFRMLASREPGTPVHIYAFGTTTTDFIEAARKLAVPVDCFPEDLRPKAGIFDRLLWLRERLAADGMRTAVWVSLPISALFAFAMRLAPVQVMWTLRHHPVRAPEIDGYITYGSWAEDSRVFHGQRWIVCPVPLALEPRTPPPQDVERLRAQFKEPMLAGTLARIEKIDSQPFLESVVAVMQRNPQCGFIWTGQSPHPGIQAFLRQRGVAERCHFVGWVDTPLYAAILDVFLETFPLGCGITGYQALGAGVPLLSYLERHTVFGLQYWSALMARAGAPAAVTREMLDEYPVLCARDPGEYVALASRLLSDAAFRDAWRAREARFYIEEIAGIARYWQRFLAAINTISAAKAA